MYWVVGNSVMCGVGSRSVPVHRSCARGGVAVETAITLPAFFALIFLGIETLRLAFVALSLQFGVVNAGRWAMLNSTVPSLTRVEAIQEKVRSASRLSLTDDQIKICPAPNSAGCSATADNAGAPGSWVSIEADFPITLGFGLANYKLTANTFVKNEPAP